MTSIEQHPAVLAGEVITEDLACCYGDHYENPGKAYVHTRCRRLLQPWGDVHDHPLCTCYGKPAATATPAHMAVLDIT